MAEAKAQPAKKAAKKAAKPKAPPVEEPVDDITEDSQEGAGDESPAAPPDPPVDEAAEGEPEPSPDEAEPDDDPEPEEGGVALRPKTLAEMTDEELEELEQGGNRPMVEDDRPSDAEALEPHTPKFDEFGEEVPDFSQFDAKEAERLEAKYMDQRRQAKERMDAEIARRRGGVIDEGSSFDPPRMGDLVNVETRQGGIHPAIVNSIEQRSWNPHLHEISVSIFLPSGTQAAIIPHSGDALANDALYAWDFRSV